MGPKRFQPKEVGRRVRLRLPGLTRRRSVSALTQQLDDFALRQFPDNACEALSGKLFSRGLQRSTPTSTCFGVTANSRGASFARPRAPGPIGCSRRLRPPPVVSVSLTRFRAIAMLCDLRVRRWSRLGGCDDHNSRLPPAAVHHRRRHRIARELQSGAPWVGRIGGLRANASSKSHSELDASPDLDIGEIAGLADDHAELLPLLSNLHLVGGCCGTDHRHIAAICTRCLT